MTKGFYVPDPLVDGIQAVVRAKLPSEIGVGIESGSVGARFVNMWPREPRLRHLTLHGPTMAVITLQFTTIDVNPKAARTIGSEVRYAFGRDRRGAFLNPIVAEGFDVLDVVFEDGHSESSGGVPTWVETATFTYQLVAG